MEALQDGSHPLEIDIFHKSVADVLLKYNWVRTERG